MISLFKVFEYKINKTGSMTHYVGEFCKLLSDGLCNEQLVIGYSQLA